MKKLLLSCILFVSAFTGCAEFEELTPADEPSTSTQTRARVEVLGFEIMENPYDLARMRRLTENNNLQPTHIYVRFLPQDGTELSLLENELALDLFDYPLDVNIEDGEEYVDPTIPEGEIYRYYVGVSADFVANC